MANKAWIVRLDFLDHCSHSGNMGGAIPITLIGVLRSEDATSYHVVSWVAGGDPYDSNSDCYSILKHKGLKMKKIAQVVID